MVSCYVSWYVLVNERGISEQMLTQRKKVDGKKSSTHLVHFFCVSFCSLFSFSFQ